MEDTDLCLSFTWFGRGIWDQLMSYQEFKGPCDFFNLEHNIYPLNVCSSLNPSFVASPLPQGISFTGASAQPAKEVNLVNGLLKQETHWDSVRRLRCLYPAAGANSCAGRVLVWCNSKQGNITIQMAAALLQGLGDSLHKIYPTGVKQASSLNQRDLFWLLCSLLF